MEPIPQQRTDDSPRIDRSRLGVDAPIVVLAMLAALLVVVVFLLLTSGSAAP
jgi:hypothetical protein